MDAAKVIVALDYQKTTDALNFVDKIDPSQCRLKVGKEMFTYFGPDFVKQLQTKGFDVFLDLKFHDIPNTCAKAVQAAAELGVWMVNVHASGGEKMMLAAREALVPYGENRPKLIGVTVLTSLSQAELNQIGYTQTLAQQVQHLAKLTHQSGLDGVVCSAQEASLLKQNFGAAFELVTPGIRPQGSDVSDQHRIMTPREAVMAGADYLVIGRPITQAANPSEVLSRIHQSINVV